MQCTSKGCTMTLELRQRHRQVIFPLGMLVGLVFMFGVLNRPSVPVMETLPPELTRQIQSFTATGEERNDLFEKAPVRVRLWRQQQNGSLAVDFIAPRDFL